MSAKTKSERHGDELSGIHVALCEHEQLVRSKELTFPTPNGAVTAVVRERLWKELRGSEPIDDAAAARVVDVAPLVEQLTAAAAEAAEAAAERETEWFRAQIPEIFLDGMRSALRCLPAPAGAGASDSARTYHRLLQTLEPRRTSDGGVELVLDSPADVALVNKGRE